MLTPEPLLLARAAAAVVHTARAFLARLTSILLCTALVVLATRAVLP